MKNIFFAILFISHYSFGQIAKLKPGNLKPGFISLTRYDISRPAVQEQPATDKGRIIQVNIWYPSIGDTRRNVFADYVKLAGKELDTALVNKNPEQKGVDKYFEWPASLGADKKKIIAFLDSQIPTQASQHAKWLIKKYPLVMIVHGFAADHAYLGEYLAGNGYIVMQVPVKGTTTYELDYEGKGLESQVRDYEFALKVVQNEFPFLAGTAAVIGFSFGGQSAAALALRNKNIKAIISFDGGIGSAFGAQLLNKQPWYDSQLITAPVLHLYNPTDSYTDLKWFDSIRNSNRFLCAMKNMEHGHFTSFGLLYKIVPGIMGKTTVDPGNGYETIMLLTKEFLNSFLKNKNSDMDNFFNTQKTVHSWIKECIVNTVTKTQGS
ncbi:MAG: hypothetical protein ACSLE0_07140 [Chitinophagaceae bacterium]